MKNLNKSFLIIFLLIFNSIIVIAQDKKSSIELEQSVEKLRLALIDANKSDLVKLTSSDLSYGHSSGKIENQEEFIANIISGKSDFVSISISNQTIKIIENTAIVRHMFSAETNNEGKPGSVSLSILLVWQKLDNNWKLIARQAVKQI